MANFTAPAASVGRRFSGFPIIVILVVCLVGGAAYFLFLKDQYFSGQNLGSQGRTAQVVQQAAVPAPPQQKEEAPQAAAAPTFPKPCTITLFPAQPLAQMS